MEWLTLPALWGVPAGLLDVWSGYYDQRQERPGAPTAALPTELDLSLIEAIYEAIAATTYCIRCGSALGRGLRIMPSSRPVTTPDTWRLLVLTRCRGWLRHAYSAEVTEVARDLRMGQFFRV